jgi:hypothetical protein
VRHGQIPVDQTALSVADVRLLELLAQLPLALLGALAPFVRRGPSTLRRRAAYLVAAGLLGGVPTPLRTRGRPRQLLYPTWSGLSAIDQDPAAGELARQLASGTPKLRRFLVARLPGLLAAYELLSLVAASGPGPASLGSWEWPWRRVVRPDVGSQRMVRLPAGARVVWVECSASSATDYVLLPDTGGLALPALRPALGRYVEYGAGGGPRSPVLVIATTTPRRAAGWAALLETVCWTRGLPPPTVEVTTWADLRTVAARRQSTPSERRIPPPSGTVRVGGPTRAVLGCRKHRSRPAPSAVGDTGLGEAERLVLDLVARHPFVPVALVADVLGHDARLSRARCRTLVARGLLRVVAEAEVPVAALVGRQLLEVTREGLRVVAGTLGLPLGAAARHHGLAGGGPTAAVGPRAALLRQLAHTVGADAVFASLAWAARAHPAGGALLEWRGPAACAHGRLGPDGYGLVRVGRRQRGFFLEFDRGSMHADQLRAKFAAYHRYAVSAHAARSYAAFPTILVVSTGPSAEQRLARAIAASDVGWSIRLPALLTTTGWLQASAEGPLGRICWTGTGGGNGE